MQGTGFQSLMKYSGSVSVPISVGGQIAVIQTIDSNSSEVNELIAGGQATHTLATPGDVLDNVPSLTQPTDPGYLLLNTAIPMQANGTATLPANFTGPARRELEMGAYD